MMYIAAAPPVSIPESPMIVTTRAATPASAPAPDSYLRAAQHQLNVSLDALGDVVRMPGYPGARVDASRRELNLARDAALAAVDHLAAIDPKHVVSLGADDLRRTITAGVRLLGPAIRGYGSIADDELAERVFRARGEFQIAEENIHEHFANL